MLWWADAVTAEMNNTSTASLMPGCTSVILQPIQDEVNHHAGDADVQPDGERPAGDAPVVIEFPDFLALQCATQCDDRQNRHGSGQRRMGEQDGEIDVSDESGFLEINGAYVGVI